MNKNTKIIIISGGIFAALVGVALLISLITQIASKPYRFYYVGINYTELRSEPRGLEIKKDEIFEKVLTQEYMLGPLDYHLRFPLDDRVFVRDVLLMEKNGKKTVILDLGGKFEYLTYKDYNFKWIIKGLVRTLKENTKVKEIIIVVNGRNKDLKIGDWDLGEPIVIK